MIWCCTCSSVGQGCRCGLDRSGVLYPQQVGYGMYCSKGGGIRHLGHKMCCGGMGGNLHRYMRDATLERG